MFNFEFYFRYKVLLIIIIGKTHLCTVHTTAYNKNATSQVIIFNFAIQLVKKKKSHPK